MITSGTRVRVFEGRRWVLGTVQGILHMPGGEYRYDVRLEKPNGDEKVLFSKKEADVEIIEMRVSNDNRMGTATL